MGSQRPWFPVLALIVGELAASAQAHPHRSLTQALNSTANTTNSTSRGLGGKYKYLSFEQILRYKTRQLQHLALVAQLRRVRAAINATNATRNGTLSYSELIRSVSLQFAQEIANLTGASDTVSRTRAAALNKTLTLLAAGASEYPSQWDSRTVGLVSPVENQGDCGTCVAFATSSSMEGSIAQATQTNALSVTPLSPQWTYFCSDIEPNITCNTGMDLDQVGYLLPSIGTQYANCYPYNPSAGARECAKAQCTGPLGPTGKWQSTDYLNQAQYVQTDFGGDILAAKAHIRKYGSVSSMFFVPAPEFYTYTGGTIQQKPPWDTSLGHAVTVIGYNDDADPPYWLVKNSWGTDWGAQGFFQIAYDGTALMLLDAVGFWYSTDRNGALPNVNRTVTTSQASMKCTATSYTGLARSGSSLILETDPITATTPASQSTYPSLVLTGSDFNDTSWSNRIVSYTLRCGCVNTGSCYSIAQGLSWTFYAQPNLGAPSVTVRFTTDNCQAATYCQVSDNLPVNFQQKVQSMSVSWTPTAGFAAPPPPPPTRIVTMLVVLLKP